MRKAIVMFIQSLVLSLIVTTAAISADVKIYWKIEVERKDYRGNAFREEIKILLNTKEAPKTTQHIIDRVKEGFFDSQRILSATRSPRPFLVNFGDRRSVLLPDSYFMDEYGVRPHKERNFSDFVAEFNKRSKAGEFKSADGKSIVGGTGARIPVETTSWKFIEGTVGLGHEHGYEGDNHVFIAMSECRFLDGQYTSFGKVIEGSKKLKDLFALLNSGDVLVKNEIIESAE